MRRTPFVFRAVFLCAASAAACGLFGDYGDEGRNAAPDPDAAVDLDVTPGPTADAGGCPPLNPCLLAKHPGRVFALAANDAGLIWVGSQGVQFLASGAPAQRTIEPTPEGADGGSVVEREGVFYWAFSPGLDRDVQSCADGCPTPPKGIAPRFARRLVANSRGVYLWRENGGRDAALESLPGVGLREWRATGLESTTLVTHFTVNEAFAFWSVDDRENHDYHCSLEACGVPDAAKITPPFVGLPKEGYVTITETGRLAACLRNGQSGCNVSVAALPLDGPSMRPEAIAIVGDETIYVGSNIFPIVFRPSAVVADAGVERITELPDAKSVTALAARGRSLFVAVDRGDGTSGIYAVDLP